MYSIYKVRQSEQKSQLQHKQLKLQQLSQTHKHRTKQLSEQHYERVERWMEEKKRELEETQTRRIGKQVD